MMPDGMNSTPRGGARSPRAGGHLDSQDLKMFSISLPILPAPLERSSSTLAVALGCGVSLWGERGIEYTESIYPLE